MIKFITDYQAEIGVAVLFTFIIFAVLLFNGVIGARPKNLKGEDGKRKAFGSNLKAYQKIESDL